MRLNQLRVWSLAAAALVGATGLVRGVAGAAPVSVGEHAAAAVDPVGNYQWSLSTPDFSVNGTLTVTRKDSTFDGSFTSDQTPGTLAAKSVSFDGKRLTAVAEGDFGTFTAMIDFNADGLAGTYKLAQPDGNTQSGPLSVKKSDK